MIGETLSHFRILDKLGEGGMGVVYRAEDERLGRNVALKVLQPGAVGNEERRLRFIREARTAASISHPNIAAIHEIDETAAGTVFIAMELVEGRTLAESLEEGPLSQREALRYAIEIAEALGRAHELGIVHRDLKPDNVMVRPDRHVKILDFGLAKLREAQQVRAHTRTTPHDKTLSMNVTRDGRVMGTANYMSPEQARGLEVDPRSDLFAFGTLLYEMVTGRKPFEAETVTDTLSAITRDAPIPPTELDASIAPELERLILKCLEKDPKDRYQHADDIAVDLRRLRRESDSQSLVGRSSTTHLPLARGRDRRLRWVAFAAGALALAIALMSLPVLVGQHDVAGPPGLPSGLRALAVMPVQNLADAADGAQLGRILQELIITDLSGIDSLRVFSSQRLYDLRKQIPQGDPDTIDTAVATQVAREAGAGAMLTGSLSQFGERWILTAQLVDLGDGSVIKSERIDGSDLYEMVDKLTARIRGDLGVGEEVALTSVREKTTESIEAWRHYVEGVEQLNRRNLEEAVHELSRAVEIDPAFGQAYIKLAVAKWWSQEPAMFAAGDSGSPQLVLDQLLSGEIKLTARERQLAEALHPLVSFDYRRARPLFEELVLQYPDEKEAWYGLGEARRHGPEGLLDLEAVRAFERALELDPTFGVAYVHVEEYYEMRRLHEEAMSKVRRLIERTHGSSEWNLVLARWLLREGQVEGAMELAQQTFARMEPPEARVDAILTFAQSLGGEHDELAHAEKLLDQAAALRVPGREARVRAAQGYHARLSGDLRRAEARFREALEADPRSSPGLAGLFSTLWEASRYSEAMREAHGRLASDDHRPLYHFWIVSASLAGDNAERDRAIEQALDRAKTPQEQRWVWLSAADGALELGDAAAADVWLREASEVKVPGESFELEMRLMRSAREQSDHDTSLKLLGQGLEQRPDLPELLVELAQIRLEQGHYEAAEQHARKVVEQSPRFPRAWSTLVAIQVLSGGDVDPASIVDEALQELALPVERLVLYREIALAYEVANRWPVAESFARRAVEVAPRRESEQALRVLAFVLAQQGRHAEAAQAIDQALAKEPSDAKLRLTRAALELQAGRPAEAERILRSLAESGPKHRVVHEALAYALAAQGQFREAEREARRAVEMARTRPAVTALAWVLIEGELDLDEGTRMAERAREIPVSLGERAAPAYQASPEHALAVAYMKRGQWSQAVTLLEHAASERPDRSQIREDLAESRSRL